jgi:hypothetical protein
MQNSGVSCCRDAPSPSTIGTICAKQTQAAGLSWWTGVSSSWHRRGATNAVIVAELTHWLITHGYPVDQVLANMAIATGPAKGRIPDIVVLHKAVPDTTHLQPGDVILVVEVVSEGSKAQDRLVKPIEYGRAGIRAFWRVEGALDLDTALVHHYRIPPPGGPVTDGYGPPYRSSRLTELLASGVPDLSNPGDDDV